MDSLQVGGVSIHHDGLPKPYAVHCFGHEGSVNRLPLQGFSPRCMPPTQGFSPRCMPNQPPIRVVSSELHPLLQGHQAYDNPLAHYIHNHMATRSPQYFRVQPCAQHMHSNPCLYSNNMPQTFYNGMMGQQDLIQCLPYGGINVSAANITNNFVVPNGPSAGGSMTCNFKAPEVDVDIFNNDNNDCLPFPIDLSSQNIGFDMNGNFLITSGSSVSPYRDGKVTMSDGKSKGVTYTNSDIQYKLNSSIVEGKHRQDVLRKHDQLLLSTNHYEQFKGNHVKNRLRHSPLQVADGNAVENTSLETIISKSYPVTEKSLSSREVDLVNSSPNVSILPDDVIEQIVSSNNDNHCNNTSMMHSDYRLPTDLETDNEKQRSNSECVNANSEYQKTSRENQHSNTEYGEPGTEYQEPNSKYRRLSNEDQFPKQNSDFSMPTAEKKEPKSECQKRSNEKRYPNTECSKLDNQFDIPISEYQRTNFERQDGSSEYSKASSSCEATPISKYVEVNTDYRKPKTAIQIPKVPCEDTDNEYQSTKSPGDYEIGNTEYRKAASGNQRLNVGYGLTENETEQQNKGHRKTSECLKPDDSEMHETLTRERQMLCEQKIDLSIEVIKGSYDIETISLCSTQKHKDVREQNKNSNKNNKTKEKNPSSDARREKPWLDHSDLDDTLKKVRPLRVHNDFNPLKGRDNQMDSLKRRKASHTENISETPGQTTSDYNMIKPHNPSIYSSDNRVYSKDSESNITPKADKKLASRENSKFDKDSMVEKAHAAMRIRNALS